MDIDDTTDGIQTTRGKIFSTLDIQNSEANEILLRNAYSMKIESSINLQALVFCLVGAGFTTIYITQPVLPVLQMEFGIDETIASFSISAVIFGIGEIIKERVSRR